MTLLAVLERLANLEVPKVPLRLADQDLPLDRYRPEVLVGPELVGRRSQAVPQSQLLRRHTHDALGDHSAAEGMG
jgi:hypothetical protein